MGWHPATCCPGEGGGCPKTHTPNQALKCRKAANGGIMPAYSNLPWSDSAGNHLVKGLFVMRISLEAAWKKRRRKKRRKRRKEGRREERRRRRKRRNRKWRTRRTKE